MAALRLGLFGGFCLSNVATESVPVATKKARALLAFLALHPGQPQVRPRLAGLLWGDSGELQASVSLRQTLSLLRRALDTPDARALVTAGDTVVLAGASIAVDVAEFHQLITAGSHEDLEQAAALYQGDLLDGFSVHAPEFEDWLAVERQRRREQMLNVLMNLLKHRGKRRERAPVGAPPRLQQQPLVCSSRRCASHHRDRHRRHATGRTAGIAAGSCKRPRNRWNWMEVEFPRFSGMCFEIYICSGNHSTA
jgi:DNA-binding winged helix-turn-helix (wHTH) protein